MINMTKKQLKFERLFARVIGIVASPEALTGKFAKELAEVKKEIKKLL